MSKKHKDYVLFRDMGNLGEGCLISLFYWLIIISVVTAFIGILINL